MAFDFRRAGPIKIEPPMSNITMVANPIQQLAATDIVIPAPIHVNTTLDVRLDAGRSEPGFVVQLLWRRRDGKVPSRLADLVTLPGVGRKTANVVLGHAFGIPGLTVDTHFGRLVRRWAWTEETDPVKVEYAVGALLPPKDWTMASHWIIFHGRRVCHARKPACGACLLAKDCPSYGAGPTEPEVAAKLVKGVEAEHLIALAERAPKPGRKAAG